MKIKAGLDQRQFLMLHPNLYILIGAFCLYADSYDLPVTITSLMESVPGRKHSTHADGRAVDISVRGWTDFHVNAVVHKLNKRYKDIAAISADDYRPRAIIHHAVEGGAEHFHLQVRPGRPEL